MATTDPGEDADMTASTAEGSAKSAELATMPLVLMYHSVSPYDEDPYEVTMTPRAVRAAHALAARSGTTRSLAWQSCSAQGSRGGVADWWG